MRMVYNRRVYDQSIGALPPKRHLFSLCESFAVYPILFP